MFTVEVTDINTGIKKTVTIHVASNPIDQKSMDNLITATGLVDKDKTQNAILRKLAIKLSEEFNNEEIYVTNVYCNDDANDASATVFYYLKSDVETPNVLFLELPLDPESEKKYSVKGPQRDYPDFIFLNTHDRYRENVIARVNNDPEFAMQIGVAFSSEVVEERLLAARDGVLADVEKGSDVYEQLSRRLKKDIDLNNDIEANIAHYKEIERLAIENYLEQPQQQYLAFVDSLAITLHNAAVGYFRTRWFANIGNTAALEADRIKFNKAFNPFIKINEKYELSPVAELIEKFHHMDITQIDKAVTTLLDNSYTKEKVNAFSFFASGLNKLNTDENKYFKTINELIWPNYHRDNFKFSDHLLHLYTENLKPGSDENPNQDTFIRDASRDLNREIDNISVKATTIKYQIIEEKLEKEEAARKAREEEARKAEQEVAKKKSAAAQSTSRGMEEIDRDLQQLDTPDQDRKEDVVVLLEDEPKKPSFWQRHKSKFISIGLGLLIAGGAAAAIVLTAPLWPITLPIIAVGGIAAGVAAAVIGISALIGYVSDKRRNAKYQSGPIPIDERSSTSADDDFGRPAAAPVPHSTAVVLSASPRSTEDTNPFVSASSAPLVTAPAQSRASSSSYQPALTPKIGSYGNGEQTPKQEFEYALAREFAKNYPKDEDTNNPFAVTEKNIMDCFRDTCSRDMDKFLQYVKDNYNQDGKGKKTIKAAIKDLLEIYPEFKPSDFHGTILEREYDMSHAISSASKGKEEAGPRKK